MIFKTRPDIPKQYETVFDFGKKNLIVSGCSYTYNNHESCAVTWPYYLRDFGGFEQVLDCSLPGAGNYHISNALQWALEVERPDPDDSLIVVMWSGHDRDDCIIPKQHVNDYLFQFAYSDDVYTGITGGQHPDCKGNTKKDFKSFAELKNKKTKAIENYLTITGLYSFLRHKQYQFTFLDYLDRSLVSRTCDFDIKDYLPNHLSSEYQKMITPMMDLYTYSLGRNYLMDDMIHPTPDGHLKWTRQHLLSILESKHK